MQKQEFEERIERTVTDEQYKVIEEVYMWHPSIRNTSGKDEVVVMAVIALVELAWLAFSIVAAYLENMK